MASHILKASSIYMQMISAFLPDPSQRQSKTSWELGHCSRSRKHTGYRLGLSRGPVKHGQEKPGFSFEEYEEHDHLKDGCKFTTCYKN